MDNDSSTDGEKIDITNLSGDSSSESEEEMRSRNRKPKLHKITWSPNLQKVNLKPFMQLVEPCHNLTPGSRILIYMEIVHILQIQDYTAKQKKVKHF